MAAPESVTRITAMATLLGLGPWLYDGFVPKPRRDACVKCGAKIPPGKAGRKCKKCRTK